jgi:antitoxin (DNA-binding transcriptional repressor) of toxin-antitoxin stability system
MGNMKVAEARARFGEILDAAEKGLPVVIERRGVRFRLIAESGATRAAVADAAMFEFVDPAVMSGQWTWRTDGVRGVKFAARRKQR